MSAVLFSAPFPVDAVRNPFQNAKRRCTVEAVASRRSYGPARRRRPRPAGGGHGGGHSGSRRPALGLGESERLQKVMSRMGVASRRESEELIAEGRVRLNGRVVRGQGVLVDARKDKITVDGEKIVVDDRAIWVAVHKPRGYLSLALHGGKRSILDLVPKHKRKGLIPIGSIDEDHSGLVIMTNERAYVEDQSSPQNRHVREWVVDCEGVIREDAVAPLRRGIHLHGDSDGTLPADVRIVGSEKVEVAVGDNRTLTRMEVRVREHRRHLISRMFEHVGLKVFHASRKSFGPILLGSLKRGQVRYLTPNEIKALTRGVKGQTRSKK